MEAAAAQEAAAIVLANERDGARPAVRRSGPKCLITGGCGFIGHHTVEHFVKNGVEAVFVSLGLDAAAGDKEGAQVHPEGFQSVAKMLRQSGLKLVLALEGGYHVGDLDIHDVLSGVEEVEHLDFDRFLGSGNFGKCLHAVALALCERTPC